MKLKTSIDTSQVEGAINLLPHTVVRHVRTRLKQELEKIVIDAGKEENHRFNSKGGFLVASIDKEVHKSGLSGEVFLDLPIAPYGEYVHRGWPRPGFESWAPDEFIYEAGDRHEDEFVQSMNSAVSLAIQKVGL